MEVLLEGQYPISPRITIGLPNKLSQVKKVGILDHTNFFRTQLRNSISLRVTLGLAKQGHIGLIIIPICNAMQLSNPGLSTVDLCTITGL